MFATQQSEIASALALPGPLTYKKSRLSFCSKVFGWGILFFAGPEALKDVSLDDAENDFFPPKMKEFIMFGHGNNDSHQ